jgi:uncharacterized protein YjfI (DUF2170 family)
MVTCHKEMNNESYMQCIKEKLLLELLQNGIFVVYNTIYYNLLGEICSTSSPILEDITDWLQNHKIRLNSMILQNFLTNTEELYVFGDISSVKDI